MQCFSLLWCIDNNSLYWWCWYSKHFTIAVLHLGNADVAGLAPFLLFGKGLPNSSGFRNCMIGDDDSFWFNLGDFGGSNTYGSKSLTYMW